MALTTTQVSQLYVALFGRASEGEGNKNWVNHNKNMIDTAALMLDTDAAKKYFGEAGETNYGFVEVIYKNTLGFDNAAQIAAWAANLDNGMSKAELVTRLLEEALSSKYAGGAPQNQLINRIDVSDYMANNVETVAAENVASTQFKSLVHPNGKLVVTDDKSTVSSAESAIDEMSGGTVIDGETFSLTTGTDTLVLTNGDDTVTGTIKTLTPNDIVADGSKNDNDTMNVELLGGTTVSSSTKVTNVEKINFNVLSGTATVDVTNVTGYKAITSNGSTGELKLTNVSNLTADYIAKGATGNLDLAFTAASVASGNDSIKVTLDGVSNGGNIVVGTGIETLNLALANGPVKVADVQTVAGLTTVTISGNQEFTNSAATGFDTTVTTVDARGASKSTFEVSATAVAVLTGAGDDSITKGTAAIAAGDLFNLGAGVDTLTTEIIGTGAKATFIGVDKIVSKAANDNFDMTNSSNAIAFDFQGGIAASVSNLSSGSTVKTTTAASAGTVAVGFKDSVMGEKTTLDLTKGATSVAVTNVKDLTIDYGDSSTGAIALDDNTVGAATSEVTTALTVNAKAGTFTGGAITTGTKLTDLTYNVSTGVTAAGTTTFAAANSLTNFTVNANSAIAFGAIGSGTKSTKLANIDINATAGNVTLAQIDAANASGITSISLDAIGGTINSGTAIINTGGNIGTVNMTGSKAIDQDFTVTVGNVDKITSTATGGVTSDITNAGAAGSTGSTITLGDAAFGKSNIITMKGTDVKNTITGGTGKDTIVSVNGDDTISLGAGDDSVNAAGGADTVTLGAGKDVYILAAAAGTGTGQTSAAGLANSHDIITDFKGAATDGDIIDGGGALLITNASANAGATVAATNAAGLVTSWATTSSSATLADKITIVEATIDNGTNALNEALLFVDSGKTYLFVSDGVSGIGANDILIELTGITASTGITLSGGDITNIA